MGTDSAENLGVSLFAFPHLLISEQAPECPTIHTTIFRWEYNYKHSNYFQRRGVIFLSKTHVERRFRDANHSDANRSKRRRRSLKAQSFGTLRNRLAPGLELIRKLKGPLRQLILDAVKAANRAHPRSGLQAMSQRRLHPKATPPEGFMSKRHTGFVARRSQTVAGMLSPRASPLCLLLINRGPFNLRISS